eukprot:c18943_g1_i1.p1 GENE.c18943_g1_i1~~c18943_g1_i1.p1  ORF type:complete len:374 (+),score=51.25 c18943_g1_i1:535-1656(+)
MIEPNLTSNVQNSELVTLVASGNKFHSNNWFGPVQAQWLHEWDEKASHLFELRFFRLTWILVSYASSAAMMVWISCRRHSLSAQSLPLLWSRCRKVCLILSGFAMVFAVVLVVLPTVHSCPNAIERVSLAETTISVHVAGVVGTGVCLHLVCTVTSMIWLSRSRVTHGRRKRKFHPGTTTRTVSRRAIVVLVWTACIMTLHVPTLLELIMASFPTNNTWGVHQFLIAMVWRLLSVWLVVSSEVLIPRLSEWCTSQYYADESDLMTTANRQELVLSLLIEERSHQSHTRSPRLRTTTEMVIASQVIVLALAPILSQLIVGDRCFGVTRKYWQPCATNTTKFDIAVDLQESNSFVSLLTQDTMWPAVRLGTVHEI